MELRDYTRRKEKWRISEEQVMACVEGRGRSI